MNLRDRLLRAGIALAIIGVGLIWRLAPPAASARAVGVVALAVAVGVECVRLIHTPSLDAFRLTLPGALLLGRIFSGWDIGAYAIGITVSAWITKRLTRLDPAPRRLQKIG